MGAPPIPDDPQANRNNRRIGIAGMPLSAIAFLLLTTVFSVLTEHYRLLDGDDFLELFGDKAASLGQLWHIQREFPLTIDPFFFHGLTFLVVRFFGISPFALRLSSLLGFLLMQLCLFYFVRRIASQRAAVFALSFPMLTAAFGYTVHVRPYGLLLGLFGLAMLSWQTAVRRPSHRSWALAVLAVSIAVAINTHYYGVLILVPLCAAELVRARQSRRVDVPVLLSIGAGMAGMVFLLPFLKGAAGFHSHYEAGAVSYRVNTQIYNFILLGQVAYSKNINRLLVLGLGLLIVLVLWGCIRQLRRKTLNLPDAEFVFLVTLAALPLFGFLLGHFVTHTLEPRYVLGSIIGIAALMAIALAPLFRNDTIARVALLLLFAAVICKGIVDVRAEQKNMQDSLASLVLSPEVKSAILTSPSQLLYTDNVFLYGFASYYEPDAYVRSHLALVYSRDEDMRWIHSDTSSRTVLHLKSFTPYTILPYESLAAQPGKHLFIVSPGAWNWIDQAFAAEHAEVTPIGNAFGREVVSVRFPGSAPGSTPFPRP